jgi:hypothetical protein
MSDLSEMLGELGDCLDGCLGDDVAPAQIEADEQNAKILRERRNKARALLHAKRREMQRAARAGNSQELGKFSIGGAFGALGKGLTAPLRIVGKVATGDFKGALKAAGDPMGIAALARKGKHTVADVKGAIRAPGAAAARMLGSASAAAKLAGATGLGGGSTIKIKCIPCDVNTAVSTDIAKKVVPEMQQVRKLLDKMELSRKATSEHNKKKRNKAWRKEVIKLLKRIQEKRCA